MAWNWQYSSYCGWELTGTESQNATPVLKISPRLSFLVLSMKLSVNTQHPKMIWDIPVQMTWFALFSWKDIFNALSTLRQMLIAQNRAQEICQSHKRHKHHATYTVQYSSARGHTTHFLSFIFALVLLFSNAKNILLTGVVIFVTYIVFTFK